MCHCLPSTVRVNNKQWKVWEVANSSPWCCHNVSILGTQTHPRHPHLPPPPTPSLPLSTSAASLHPDPSPAPETQRGGRLTSPRRPLRNHGRVWFCLEQGSHLFWAHLCWLIHVLTGKLAACSMGRGPTSAVGYQFLTCPASFWAPLQLTTSANAPIATHSHPPTYSNQPSSALYFCRFSAATYRPAFSVKLRKWHCFTMSHSNEVT